MKKTIFLIILVGIVFLSGCVEQGEKPLTEKLKEICIRACETESSRGTNLNNGPCLLNPVQEYPDWVCDVAHEPRETVDNQPENQCSAFREGRASHFIEVTPGCKFIKAW